MVQIDMPMPKTCGECRFMDEGHGNYPWCEALKEDRGYFFDVNTKRFPNCPLKAEERDGETEKLKELCRVLFNRCRAVGSGNGVMCVFCGMKEECKTMHSI